MSYILSCLLAGPLALALNAHRPHAFIVPRPDWREPLPVGLSFASDAGVTVHDSVAFADLFPSVDTCSRDLTRNEVRVHPAGENLLNVSVNGLSSWRLASGVAIYVPVHYRDGQVIHPYFIVRTPDRGTFFVEIRTLTTGRRLSVSRVQGETGAESLVPVFTTN